MAQTSADVLSLAAAASDLRNNRNSLWWDAYRRLTRDKIAIFCFWVIVVYALMAILAKLGILFPNGRDQGAPTQPTNLVCLLNPAAINTFVALDLIRVVLDTFVGEAGSVLPINVSPLNIIEVSHVQGRDLVGQQPMYGFVN